MISLVRIHFWTPERAPGFIHPDGDGWRNMIAFEREDAVVLLSPSTLRSETYDPEVYAALKPTMIELNPHSLIALVRDNAERHDRMRLEHDRENTTFVLGMLQAMTTPPRVRIRSNAPTSHVPA